MGTPSQSKPVAWQNSTVLYEELESIDTPSPEIQRVIMQIKNDVHSLCQPRHQFTSNTIYMHSKPESKKLRPQAASVYKAQLTNLQACIEDKGETIAAIMDNKIMMTTGTTDSHDRIVAYHRDWIQAACKRLKERASQSKSSMSGKGVPRGLFNSEQYQHIHRDVFTSAAATLEVIEATMDEWPANDNTLSRIGDALHDCVNREPNACQVACAVMTVLSILLEFRVKLAFMAPLTPLLTKLPDPVHMIRQWISNWECLLPLALRSLMSYTCDQAHEYMKEINERVANIQEVWKEVEVLQYMFQELHIPNLAKRANVTENELWDNLQNVQEDQAQGEWDPGLDTVNTVRASPTKEVLAPVTTVVVGEQKKADDVSSSDDDSQYKDTTCHEKSTSDISDLLQEDDQNGADAVNDIQAEDENKEEGGQQGQQ